MPTQIDGNTGVSKVQDGVVVHADLANTYNTLGNYVNDAAAQAGGVAIGQLYRNGSVLMVRAA